MLIRQHATCPQCDGGIEEALHTLRDCFVVNRIWQKPIPSSDYGNFFSIPLREWLFQNLNNNGHWDKNCDWACIFGVALWRIWYWHKKYAFEGSATSMVIDIKSRVEEIHRVFDIFDINKCKRVEKYFGWLPPVWLAYKLNIDGACKASGSASVGGLSRDAHWGWIKGFGINIGVCSITKVDLWGMYQGLILAWNKGIRLLIVEVDSYVLHSRSNVKLCPLMHHLLLSMASKSSSLAIGKF